MMPPNIQPKALVGRLRQRFSRNSLAGGAGYLTLVQIARLLLLLLASSIVLRHFGPARFGVIALALAVFESILALQVQVGQAVQTFVPQLLMAKNNASVKLVLWSGYLLRAISFGLLGVTLILISPLAGKFYADPQLSGLVFILGISAMSRALSGPIDLNAMFALTRYRDIAVLNLLEIFGSLAAAVMTWWLDLSPTGYLWAMLLSLIPSYIFCWLLYPGVSKKFDWKTQKAKESQREWVVKMFRFGVPISVSAIFYQASLQIGILVSGRFFSAELVGQFGFAVNTARRAWGIISYVETLLLSHFAKAHTTGRAAMERATIVYGSMLFALALGTGTAFILFAREATLILGGNQYLPAVPLLQVLVVQFLFRGYEYLRFATYASHEPKKMVTATMVKIVSEICAIAVLLPLMGMEGLVLAHVLSYVIYSAVIVWAASRVIMDPHHVILMLRYQLVMALCGTAVLSGAILSSELLEKLAPLSSLAVRAFMVVAVGAGMLIFVRNAYVRGTLQKAKPIISS